MNLLSAFRPLSAALLALAAGASGAWAVAAAPDAGTTGSTPYVLDARVVGDDSRVRFIADISVPVDATVFTLADPYRIIVDLPEVKFVMPDEAGKDGRGLMSAFRYGDIAKGKSRIVIDLTGPVEVDKEFVVPPSGGQPARFVIDAVPTTRDKFLAVAKAYRDRHGASDLGDGQGVAAGGASDRPVIVLDPGHGGIDSGAHGPGGTLEKDVVLAFAKQLGEQLVATGRYRVVYTRDDDTFLSLGERVKIARTRNAALMVSIHANSFGLRSVRGTSIYTVSDEASNKMAAQMAESENASDALAGIDLDAQDSDEVKNILLDLTRRETHNFGVVFAQNLVKYLSKTTRMFKVPHQEAGFKVLEAPDVPSALIELGYLTNPDDEQQLASPEWQDKVAGSMVDAIDSYFNKKTAEIGVLESGGG